jgi:hypothetical protein
MTESRRRRVVQKEGLMTKARVLALLALLVLWPTPAHAAKGFWGWLEELSGPGPFNGPVAAMSLKCWHDDESRPCRPLKGHNRDVSNRNAEINQTFDISVGWLRSGNNPRFKDLVGSVNDSPDNYRNVTVVPVSGLFLFRPHRSVDIGPGAGVLLFFGDDVDAKPRLVLIPVSATWKPLLSTEWLRAHWGRVGRVVNLEFQASYITKGFTGADFGSTVTAYKPVREVLGTWGISIDFREW